MPAETFYDLLLEGEETQRQTGAELPAANGLCRDEIAPLEMVDNSVEPLEAAQKAEADSAWEIRLMCVTGPLKGQYWSFKSVFRIGRLDSVDLRLIEPEGS